MTTLEMYNDRFAQLERVERQFKELQQKVAKVQNAATAGARLLLTLLAYAGTAPPCRIKPHGDEVAFEWENQHVSMCIYIDCHTSGIQVETVTPGDGTPFKTTKRVVTWSEKGIVYSEAMQI